jgi:hypothetical protein
MLVVVLTRLCLVIRLPGISQQWEPNISPPIQRGLGQRHIAHVHLRPTPVIRSDKKRPRVARSRVSGLKEDLSYFAARHTDQSQQPRTEQPRRGGDGNHNRGADRETEPVLLLRVGPGQLAVGPLKLDGAVDFAAVHGVAGCQNGAAAVHDVGTAALDGERLAIIVKHE